VGAVSLATRLLLALAYVLVLAIVALEVPLALSVRDRVDAEVRSQARGQAELVAATVSRGLDRQSMVRTVAATAARTVRGRVVVVDAKGAIVADSAGTGRVGEDYSNRPEIASALRGRPAQERRHSDTLGRDLLATAVPVVAGNAIEGAVRVTQDVGAVTRATRRATVGLVAIGLMVLILGLAAGWLIARQIAGPLRRLDDAARRVGDGDLGARARVEGSAEQRRLARTFNDMTARVERLVASQRDFVADASHQLRTPLSGLRLRLEEAQAATSEPDAREEIDAGLAELDRLTAMVGALLALSQVGEVDAPAESVDLAAAARAAADRWDGAEGATVRADASEPVLARCPPAELARALDALVENAIRYGGGDVTVTARPGGLEVRDRGPGLDPEELAAVFERFHRGRAGRGGDAPGTGLGLPIARELARRWGGDVELANHPDGGAVATLQVSARVLRTVS
jgi:two-component system, OmpR family, sensor kinase